MSNSSYSDYDFTESMRIAGVDIDEIAEVLWAYGNVDREGQCCDQCGGEWSGGFAFRMNSGRIGVVEGWCDYTGWGCQDGAGVEWYETVPDAPNGADIAPADLNHCLSGK